MAGPHSGLAELELPRYAGERYEAEVPDTLDLAERAELAIHAITSMLDPARDFQMAGTASFDRRPPVLNFGWRAVVCEAKHLEALPLLRIMSGSSLNMEADRDFMLSHIRLIGDDGVMYWSPNAANRPGPPPPLAEPFALVEGEGRHILTECMWYQRDRDPGWLALVEKKIERLNELAAEEDDFVYFTTHEPPDTEKDVRIWFTARDTADTLRDPSGGRGWFGDLIRSHEINFQTSRSLCIYYRLTGYEPALELAGKIIRGVLKVSKGFHDDGRWILSHFHTATASLLAILEYADITGDDELLQFVTRCYEYGRVAGDALVGFFAEHARDSEEYRSGWGGYWPGEDWEEAGHKTPNPRDNTCETCEVADMVALALKLTELGAGDYWEDVDRWVRNQYVENQLTQDKLGTLLRNLNSGGLFRERPVQSWNDERVERAVGAFTGGARPNDLGLQLSHACCTGNGGRTLYWVWDRILTRDDDGVRINLLLNRASPWVDVNSHLPYEGKVTLKVKQARKVALRVPEWTAAGHVTCQLNGKETSHTRSGSYVELQGLAAGDAVTVQFPMRQETVFSPIGDHVYRLALKGNTVVEMDPEGPICPLYQRSGYKKDSAPVKKVTRFASPESILW